jgi:hypothetical protein
MIKPIPLFRLSPAEFYLEDISKSTKKVASSLFKPELLFELDEPEVLFELEEPEVLLMMRGSEEKVY